MACRACEAAPRTRPGTGGTSAGHGRPAAMPLPAAIRRRFEGAMGVGLAHVRIHADQPAAAQIGAAAFTRGADIRFAPGAWRPGTPAGDRLIAHELAHVVQQQGGTGPATASHETEADAVAAAVTAGGRATPALRLAPQVQLQPRTGLLGEDWQLRGPTLPPPPLFWPGQIREAIVLPELPALPELHFDFPSVGWQPRPLWEPPSLTLDPALRFTPVRIIPIPRREPDRALTWADFPGNAVPGGFGAITRMQVRQLHPDGNTMFQARMLATSAVRPRIRNAADRAHNGCAATVAQCQAFLGANPGGSWSTSRPVPDNCPAGIMVPRTAATADECETVIGTGCDTDAAADSVRLLAHEQGHFDIGWRLVIKANDALLAGTHRVPALQAWITANLGPLQEQYDHQTNHGCIAAQQASWVAALAAGLPAVPLPAPAAP